MPEGNAPVATSHPRTLHDSSPLPGGRIVGDVPSDALARMLTGLCVPNTSFSQGRAENAAAYATHLQKIYDAAGKAAVAKWVNSQ